MMPKLCSGLVVLMVALAAPPAVCGQAGEADFYVAPNGNDRWSGRLAEPNASGTDGPLATLNGARDAVRQFQRQSNGLNRDLVIWIREGVYRLTAPIVFGPEDSGTESHSITYGAYPGEHPVISGGRTISGWTKGERGLWSAEVPGVKAGQFYFRQLFVNGGRRTRARTPNEGFFRIEKAFGSDRTKFQFYGSDLQSWSRLGDVELVLFYDWDLARAKLAAVDEESRIVRFGGPVGYLDLGFLDFNKFEEHQRYYLENAAEFVDAPGEWYLDRGTGILTYRAFREEDLTTGEVVAPAAEQLLVVRGTLERPVRNLRFRGLRLEHTEFPLPPEGYGGIQAGHYGVRGDEWKQIPAAVEFESAVGCRLEGCRLTRLGTSGVALRQGCQGNAISGNEIADVGGNGAQVGEPSGEAQPPTRNPNPANPAVLVRDNIVANNYIHHSGQDYFGTVGVWVGYAQGTVVAHNLIHDLPYTGISVGWDWDTKPTAAKNNRIEFNHIHHVMQKLSDGGGIYTLGWQPGTVLRGNHIHDVDRLHGRAEQNGMFIDEGSKGYLIEGQVIYRVFGGSVIRFNKSEASWHEFRNNSFGIGPDDPEFPAARAAEAGLEPAYRKRLLGGL